jgi:hypothetical protein
MVMRGVDFAGVAKDLPGFKRTFAKSLSSALGLPLAAVEVLNVACGSVVVEFRLYPQCKGGDQRGPADLQLALEGQLSNQHSTLRKGPLSAYTMNAEVLIGEPKRVGMEPGGEVTEARCYRGFAVEYKDGAPPPSAEMEVQTDPAELATPRLKKPGPDAPSASNKRTSKQPELDGFISPELLELLSEDPELNVKLKELQQQMQQMKARTKTAEDNLTKAQAELEEKNKLMLQLKEEEEARDAEKRARLKIKADMTSPVATPRPE